MGERRGEGGGREREQGRQIHFLRREKGRGSQHERRGGESMGVEGREGVQTSSIVKVLAKKHEGCLGGVLSLPSGLRFYFFHLFSHSF